MRYINGYDDVEIVAGAGTIGMEMLEQVRKENDIHEEGLKKTREKYMLSLSFAIYCFLFFVPCCLLLLLWLFRGAQSRTTRKNVYRTENMGDYTTCALVFSYHSATKPAKTCSDTDIIQAFFFVKS